MLKLGKGFLKVRLCACEQSILLAEDPVVFVYKRLDVFNFVYIPFCFKYKLLKIFNGFVSIFKHSHRCNNIFEFRVFKYVG